MTTDVFLDTFTDANGTRLGDHTPDTAPAGYTYHEFLTGDINGETPRLEIQNNKLIFVDLTVGGAFKSDFADAWSNDSLVLGLTYPFTMSFTGKRDSFDTDTTFTG